MPKPQLLKAAIYEPANPPVSVQKCHNAPICGLFVKFANFIFKFLSLKILLIQADCHWK